MYNPDQLKSLIATPTDNIILQLPRALVSSVIAATVDVCGLIVLVELVKLPPITAAVGSYMLGSLTQYMLCCHWVFSSTLREKSVSFTYFTALSLFGLAITWAVMAVAHDFGGIHYLIAKFAALGISFAWNFLSRRYLLFRH